MQLFGNSKGCFLDRVAAEMLIGLKIKRWQWNEWGKHSYIFLIDLIHCYFELRYFGVVWFIGEYINSCHGKLIRKKVQTRLCAFLTLILLCLQFFDTLIKQCRTTFAPKIRFEQNDSIPPPYQFKRGDVRLNLHYESIDWNEAF